jgi:hypothetical protein
LNEPVFGGDDFVHRVIGEIPLKRVATADGITLSIAFTA